MEGDFSFPITITDSQPSFIESPPLWNKTDETLKGKEEEQVKQFKLCSFQEFEESCVRCQKSNYDDANDFDDEEEKMDVLWENLNDDRCMRTSDKRAQKCDTSPLSPDREVQVRMRCATTLKLSKASDRINLSGKLKKPSMVLLVKALKKVFINMYDSDIHSRNAGKG